MRYLNSQLQTSASDLANYLGCKHLSKLDFSVAEGKRKAPSWQDPANAILAKRGQEHEEAYIAFLKEKGFGVVDLNGQPTEATIEAMASGVDVITQANLGNENWVGRADILVKVAGKSCFGHWTYEIEDTKLAQETKAGTILQLSLYSDLLEQLQGFMPKAMTVVKPSDNFEKEVFLVSDFKAYYRLVKKSFEGYLKQEIVKTYPYPVAHCDYCRWWKECDDKRRADDHLSLVAGIRSVQMFELERQKVYKLEQFAKAVKPLSDKPERGNKQTYFKIHNQAKIQFRGRKEGLVYEHIDYKAEKGLTRLPEPSGSDIYFDIEGDPFCDRGGLEYILGYVVKGKDGKLSYHYHQALNHQQEKIAFENFVDFVMERWSNDSGMFIYHFAPYEPGAVKRLASKHGTKEAEVDKLLRAKRFVDLYSIFREGLRASVERYSLKDLELFTEFKRKIELRIAGAARRQVEFALELNAIEEVPPEILTIVREYNEDDCVATEGLHRWLEERLIELKGKVGELARPLNNDGVASEKTQALEGVALEVYTKLLAGLPDNKSILNDIERGRWVLANMIDYFRREERCNWWEFFGTQGKDFEDLLEDRNAIIGLEHSGRDGGTDKNPIHVYSFPNQEISLRPGDDAYDIERDTILKIGTLEELSIAEGILKIKKTQKTIEKHPTGILSIDQIPSDVLKASLLSFAKAVATNGIDGDGLYRSGRDLLLRKSPRLGTQASGDLMLPKEEASAAAIRICKDLNNSILPIQGPPGTGKSHTGAEMIVELSKAGKRVGVTAISHKVIRGLLEKALRIASEESVNLKVVDKTSSKSTSAPSGLEEESDNTKALIALDNGKVVGATAWLWAREDAVEKLDYLFVDEAGQMSLAMVLAASRAAKNIILLGDPQQLEQPQKGSHPEGADAAALNHILGNHKTMPLDKGLFLGVSRRLNPKICEFTSEVYYEGRLINFNGTEKQVITGSDKFYGSGLFYVPVEHTGNQSRSLEEVETIAGIVGHLLSGAVHWTDESGANKKLTPSDILVVAPYNLQVEALTNKLPNIQVGTVDRFQGHEAPVVIYSMTSSSMEEAPRGMSFLYNPNRLNVATSRAKCICILVATSKILEPDCHSIDQMRWANGICRFRELAKEVVT